MSFKLFAFDAYGTLFDVHSAVARHSERIGENASRLSEIWRTKQLEYTWVRTLTGAYRDFETVTADALEFAAVQTGGLPESLMDELMAAYRQLDAYADAKPALESIRAASIKTAILSNGTPAMLESGAASAGISGDLDAIISVDPLRRYKTAAEVYQLACDHFGVRPSEVSFQSSNRWDIAGAHKAGFRTVWVNRSGQPDEYHDLRPDHAVRTLEGLLQLS